MDYELARAQVLLRDLELIGRGRATAVQLGPSPDGLGVRGTGSRLGLMRAAARLAHAALTARSVVVFHENGGVSENTAAPDALVQVLLIDDPPPVSVPTNDWFWRLVTLVSLMVAALTVVGLITVVRWITTYLGT